MMTGANSEVGLAVLGVQVQQLSKDVAALEHELAAHRADHEAEAKDRLRSRRWIISAVIAVVGAVDGPLVAVLMHAH
jgi:hypothetical protein